MASQPCLPANAPRQPCEQSACLFACSQTMSGCLVVGLTKLLAGLLPCACQTHSQPHVLTPNPTTA